LTRAAIRAILPEEVLTVKWLSFLIVVAAVVAALWYAGILQAVGGALLALLRSLWR
jgi:hypothetical protein